ncbi:hypothetical protein PTTG_27251 [Puccinia triticina 1-1 BBBD Race 1]|uniref:Uncharacterized protein n=1 Tax=Puccinia triticina (isolate 1-1 / race 1 (BBBD)) TaxID=630390 RepID=A0A180GP04_PUCT1|nr:hypothetical protein PTTG_27251 [Puccinia triticina 1-1 BBBD Race 1]
MYLLDTFGFDFQPGYNYEPCGPSVLRKLSRTSGGPETKVISEPEEQGGHENPADHDGPSAARKRAQSRPTLSVQTFLKTDLGKVQLEYWNNLVNLFISSPLPTHLTGSPSSPIALSASWSPPGISMSTSRNASGFRANLSGLLAPPIEGLSGDYPLPYLKEFQPASTPGRQDGSSVPTGRLTEKRVRAP